MNEKWKSVVGYEGYEVSNLGRIRSYRRRGRYSGKVTIPRILNPTVSQKVRLVVRLGGFKQGRTVQVHRVVLEAFVGAAPPGTECCHNDGNFRNNCLNNLRWDTRAGNVEDTKRHGTISRGTRNGRAKLSEEAVAKIRRLLASGIVETSIAARFGVSRGAVNDIRRRKTWKHL